MMVFCNPSGIQTDAELRRVMVRERDVEFLWAFACACENRAEACRRNAPQNCLCLSKPSSLKVLELVSMNMFYAKQLWGTCDFGQTIPVFVSLRRTWSPAISLTAVRKRCMDSRGGFSVCVCVCVCVKQQSHSTEKDTGWKLPNYAKQEII